MLCLLVPQVISKEIKEYDNKVFENSIHIGVQSKWICNELDNETKPKGGELVIKTKSSTIFGNGVTLTWLTFFMT